MHNRPAAETPEARRAGQLTGLYCSPLPTCLQLAPSSFFMDEPEKYKLLRPFSLRKLLELSLGRAGKQSENSHTEFPAIEVQEAWLRGQGISLGFLTENL